MLIRLVHKLSLFISLFLVTNIYLNQLESSIQPTLTKNYSLLSPEPPKQATVFAALPNQNANVITSVRAADARAEILHQYLKRYSSPLVPYANLLVQMADENDFDFRWMVAIAQQESNLCKFIPENSYNCWGWGIYGDKITRFSSYEDAIKKIAPQFKRIFLQDKHIKDPRDVMKTYTPPSDGSWADGVSQFFSDLE